MATREQLIEALRKADAAGDTEAARAIARRIKESEAPAPAPEKGMAGRAFDFVTENVAEPISGIIESGTQLASGVVAEPIAGIAGVLSAPFTDSPGDVVRNTREALTYRPKTGTGQAISGAVGRALAPVGEAVKGAETFLGDQTFEKTGSPALAAAATTLPTAILELIGVKGAKKAAPGMARQPSSGKLLAEAAPPVELLKETSRKVYQEIDDLGVTVKPEALKSLTNSIDDLLKKEAAIKEGTPKAFGALQAFKNRAKSNVQIPLSELDKLRQTIREAPSAVELGEQRLAGLIVDEIDDFMDKSGATAFNAPEGVKVGARYKVARDLYSRAKKSEMISETLDRASRRSTNFNSALKNEFNSILNSKKKAKYFSKQELAEIRKIVEQPAKQNLAEFIGKFGFESPGPSSNFLGGSIGTTAGAVLGGALGGPAGATVGGVLVPTIGTVSRKLASKMRANRAALADQVIRAGYDGQKIANAYIKNVPAAARSADELSLLLMHPSVAMEKLAIENPLIRQAAELAAQRRAEFAGALAPTAVTGEEEQ